MTTWPDEFIYVCSAGRAQIVNALPLVHAGQGRVARIVILCGASTLSSTDPRIMAEAITPAVKLKEIFHSWCPGVDITIATGEPDDMAVWHGHMTEIARAASPQQPVIFNLTGGRKQMSIGAFAAMLRLPPETVKLIFVAGEPARVDFLDLATLRPVPAPIAQELTLAQYLGLYNCREIRRAEREEVMRTFAKLDAVVTTFAAALGDQGDVAQQLIIRAVRALLSDKGRFKGPGIVDPWTTDGNYNRNLRSHVAQALQLWDGHVGMSAAINADGRPTLHVTSEAGARMLESAWYEALLFNRIRTHFRGDRHVSVFANVHVSQAGSREAGEMDVAVLIGSQLHIVEAKVSNMSEGATRSTAKAMAQITNWKQMFLGPFGRVIVSKPGAADLDTSFETRASAVGAYLAIGPRSVETTIEILSRPVHASE